MPARHLRQRESFVIMEDSSVFSKRGAAARREAKKF
jgi:hypothetical protein